MNKKEFIDLTNKIFGKWTVISRGPNDGGGWARWWCKCQCGKIVLVTRSSLRNGRSKGCSDCNKRNRSHGKSTNKIYKIWDSMIQRCHNFNDAAFSDYGGRGITVCNEWREDFNNFFKDMGNCPRGHSIDRVNNEFGYYKENCRWATQTQQNRNRRNSVKIGDVFSSWKFIDPYYSSTHALAHCIQCGHQICYDRSWLKRGKKRCPNCI